MAALYPGHIPLSTLQRVLLGAGSAAVCMLRPHRGDMVAVMGETTGGYALKGMYKSMSEDEEGKQILQDKPIIRTTTLNMDYLKSLKPGTLGAEYLAFLDRYNYSPDARPNVQFIDDIELAYVMKRYREVHDIVHTLLRMPTNMQGEVAVKWVEALQTKLPMCATGALFGPLRFLPKQRANYVDKYLKWAIEVGMNAKPLLNVYYEKRWEQDMDELRQELNIPPNPS